jgi:hypothetical protein
MIKRSHLSAALLFIIGFAAVSFAVVLSYSSTSTTRLARSSLASIRLVFTPWQARLYSPTEFTKIGSLYFIVDSWHDRVLYSHSIDAPIREWRVLDSDLATPTPLLLTQRCTLWRIQTGMRFAFTGTVMTVFG